MPASWPSLSHFWKWPYPGGATAGAMPTRSKPSRRAWALSCRVSSAAVMGTDRSGSVEGPFLESFRVLDPEVVVYLPGRIRAVEGVEVDSPHLVIQQVAALLRGPVNADLGHGLGVVAAPRDGFQE